MQSVNCCPVFNSLILQPVMAAYSFLGHILPLNYIFSPSSPSLPHSLSLTPLTPHFLLGTITTGPTSHTWFQKPSSSTFYCSSKVNMQKPTSIHLSNCLLLSCSYCVLYHKTGQVDGITDLSRLVTQVSICMHYMYLYLRNSVACAI